MTKCTDIRPTELVCESIAVDSSIAPSKIQGNSILSAIRKIKSWVEIGKVVEKVTDEKTISNEKLKQKRIMQPYGSKFKAIEEYKEYADQKDKFLVYKVDENKQIVFQSSPKCLCLLILFQKNFAILMGKLIEQGTLQL